MADAVEQKHKGTVGVEMREMSRRKRQIAVVLRLLSLVLVLAVWQWYGSQPAHVATPPPTEVFPALWDAILHQDLLGLTWGTLVEVAVGLAISLVFGIVVGFAIALFPWAKDTLDPLVDAAYAMPTIMLIPIIGVYTGLGFRGRIFIVFLYVALVIVVSTSVGVREVDAKLLETAHAFGLKGLRLFRKVMFPAALSHIAAGTAIGVSRAVRGAVAAELLLITANLGGFIIDMQARFNNKALIAGILWTLFIGYALYEGALWVERRLTPWRTTTS